MAITKKSVESAYHQLIETYGEKIQYCYDNFEEYPENFYRAVDAYWEMLDSYKSQESKQWGVNFRTAYDSCDIPIPKLLVYACEVYEVEHSYSDWTGDPSKDYGDIINQSLYDYVNGNIIDCDNCSGCGDW